MVLPQREVCQKRSASTGASEVSSEGSGNFSQEHWISVMETIPIEITTITIENGNNEKY